MLYFYFGLKIMKLYQIPQNSKIYLKDGSYCIFEKIDGLYSFCTTEKFNEVVHLSVNTPLEPYLDGYKIKEETNE